MLTKFVCKMDSQIVVLQKQILNQMIPNYKSVVPSFFFVLFHLMFKTHTQHFHKLNESLPQIEQFSPVFAN